MLKERLKHILLFEEDAASEQEVISGIVQSVDFRGAKLWILVLAVFVASLGLIVPTKMIHESKMCPRTLMGHYSTNITDMKNSLTFAFALAALVLTSCGTKPTAGHRLIAPLPAGIAIDDLQDCTIPVAFTPQDFNWMGGNLTMTVYSQDLYDAVEISQMQVGDTIIYNGNKMVVGKIAEEHGGIDINGGLDEGGCCLAGNEGGTYVARNWDDHATYTELGKAELPLADDFVIIDCGMNPQDPSDTILTGQKLYIENLKDGNRDFFQLNTRVTIENGMITEINRRWIP